MQNPPEFGSSTAGLIRPLSLKSRLYMLTPKGRFKVIQRHVGGMLDWRTYREIYRRLKAHPDLDAVEVGAARGAGSIAAALAYKDTNARGRLIVVEKFEGGSRTADGSYTHNLESAKALFRQFGVADHIRLFPHHLSLKNGPEAVSLIKTGKISALIHDADGRIDRDFELFWPLLIDGGFILIDDYEDAVQEKVAPDGRELRFTKKVLTYRLLNLFAEWGLFKFDKVESATAFGHKPSGADFSRFDRAACRRIVEEARALAVH